MTWRSFWFGCWFEHSAETFWTRERLECQRCGEPIEVLPQATVRGPAHEPDQVRGIPNVWAKTVKQGKLIKGEFDRVSER